MESGAENKVTENARGKMWAKYLPAKSINDETIALPVRNEKGKS